MFLLLPIAVQVVKTPAGAFRLDQIVVLAGMVFLFTGIVSAVRKAVTTPLDRHILLLILVWLISGTLMSSLILQLGGSLDSRWTPIVTPSRHVPFVRSATAIGNYLIGLGCYYLITNSLRDAKALMKGLVFWMMGAGWASLFQIVAFVAYFFGVDLTAQVGGVTIPTLFGGRIMPRVGGVGGEPRHMAMFFFIILPFWLFITLNGVYIVRPAWQRMLVLVCGIGLLLTLAKSILVLGSITLVSLLAGQMWLMPSAWPVIRAMLKLIVMLAVISLPVFLLLNAFGMPTPGEIFNSMVDQLVEPSHSNTGMQIGFETAWKMGWAFPLLGVGPDNFQFYTDKFIPMELITFQYQVFGQAQPASSPNNAFLALFAETGLIGLGVFCALLLVPLRASIRLVRKSRDRATRVLLIGMTLSYTNCFIGLGTVVGFWFLPFVWTVVGLMVTMQMIVSKSGVCTLSDLIYKPSPLRHRIRNRIAA
jgi:O-antigen ligase